MTTGDALVGLRPVIGLTERTAARVARGGGAGAGGDGSGSGETVTGLGATGAALGGGAEEDPQAVASRQSRTRGRRNTPSTVGAVGLGGPATRGVRRGLWAPSR